MTPSWVPRAQLPLTLFCRLALEETEPGRLWLGKKGVVREVIVVLLKFTSNGSLGMWPDLPMQLVKMSSGIGCVLNEMTCPYEKKSGHTSTHRGGHVRMRQRLEWCSCKPRKA